MSASELLVRHFRTGDTIRVFLEDGAEPAFETCPLEADPNLWLAPSLVDPQINGYAGIDFQQDELTRDALLDAARALRRDGCDRWLLTLITDDWPRLLDRLSHIRTLRSDTPELERCILGWHIEGPFLSAEPGYAGAHNPSVMCDPTPEKVRALRAATGADPVLLTLAPERAGSLDAIRQATALGITVSLGHTNTSADALRQAIQAGATGFTHLGNGCPRLLDRHDNILWRVLDTPGLTVGFIVDGIHVSPALLRLSHRLLDPSRLYFTTDAMAAAGAPPGRYKLARLELDVGEDQIVRQPGSPLFAGSALRPIDGICRAAAMLNRSWQEVWPHFSAVPASLLGWTEERPANRPTTFYLIETDAQNAIKSLRPLTAGGQALAVAS